MLRRFWALSAIRLINALGFNEARHCRDKKKKRRLVSMLALYAFIILLAAFYTALIALGLCSIGLGDVIPIMLCALTGLGTLVLTFAKAGGELYSLEAYEREAALPVKPFEIVLSRFLVMYVPAALLSLLVTALGYGVYAYFARPGASGYLMAALGALFTPLIPMSIACVLAALITALASVMRHKNIVNAILALIVTLGLMAFPMFLRDDPDPAIFFALSRAFRNLMGKIYPPSLWFEAGVLSGNWGWFALFCGVSLIVFAATVALVQWKLADICRALGARATRADFSLTAQRGASPLLALYKKDLGRYFASPIYVVNTVIGYVMMLAGAIAVSFAGLGALDYYIPGGFIGRFLPFVLAGLCSITGTTCSSVSIEGKQWWIAQTLPVPARAVLDAKLLVQFTVALPFYFASCLILNLSLSLSSLQTFCLWATPLGYICLTAVIGLTVNLAFPKFNWDRETDVVKQGASVGLSMLAGIAAVAIPILAVLLIPGANVDSVCLIAGIAAFVLALILRRINNSRDLRDVAESV